MELIALDQCCVLAQPSVDMVINCVSVAAKMPFGIRSRIGSRSVKVAAEDAVPSIHCTN